MDALPIFLLLAPPILGIVALVMLFLLVGKARARRAAGQPAGLLVLGAAAAALIAFGIGMCYVVMITSLPLR